MPIDPSSTPTSYFDYLQVQAVYIRYKTTLFHVAAGREKAVALPLLPSLAPGATLAPNLAATNAQLAGLEAALRQCLTGDNKVAAITSVQEAVVIIDKLNDLLEVAKMDSGASVANDNTQDTLSNLYETLLEQDRQLRKEKAQHLLTQKAKERAEQQFNSIVLQAPVGITLLRAPDLVVEFANEAYLQIVDHTAADFIGKELFASLPEVREAVAPIVAQVLASGEPFFGNEFEVPLNRFGHTALSYFNFVYQPLFAATGEVSGIMVIAHDVTQMVQVRQALIQTENHFRDLVIQSPVAMTIFKGRDWIIDIANETLLTHIWRRPLQEVQGRKLMEVFPELADQPFPRLLEQVYNTGERYSEREAEAFVEGDGGLQKYYLDFEYAPLRTADGAVSGIMVTVNDVTAMVEARKQVRDAAERLSLATDGTQLATWDMNLLTQEILYSPRLAAIFGYPESKILNHRQLRTHVHPDDRESIVEKAFDTALRSGVYQYDARLIHPDKSVHWVRTQGKVLFDDDKKPVRMLGTMMDITEQKRAEQAIKESERKFRTLADSMPQHIWTANTSGQLRYFNETVSRYTGFSAEALLAGAWMQVIHPDDWHATMHAWLHAVRMDEDFLFEHRFRRSDGAYRWQLSRAIPQRDDEGRIQMWVGTSTDIHDHKLFSDELEQKVQQRTEELVLLNERLLQSNSELEQFAYIASHDLQEPLRKIQTFATRISELDATRLSDKGRDYFDRMQSASKRMQQLIHDVLSFSRINKGEQDYVWTDLDTLLGGVQEQLNERIEQSGTEIRKDKLPALPVIAYQMDQLFTNLITNSIKFSRPDLKTRININYTLLPAGKTPVAAADPERPYHCIRFQDNGIGFESSFRERIFQVFQRLHGRKEYEGTGIGLAICKKIMDNHNGFIIAESEPGAGATFIIYLPAE